MNLLLCLPLIALWSSAVDGAEMKQSLGKTSSFPAFSDSKRLLKLLEGFHWDLLSCCYLVEIFLGGLHGTYWSLPVMPRCWPSPPCIVQEATALQPSVLEGERAGHCHPCTVTALRASGMEEIPTNWVVWKYGTKKDIFSLEVPKVAGIWKVPSASR